MQKKYERKKIIVYCIMVFAVMLCGCMIGIGL